MPPKRWAIVINTWLITPLHERRWMNNVYHERDFSKNTLLPKVCGKNTKVEMFVPLLKKY
jgi:hypothetical protein